MNNCVECRFWDVTDPRRNLGECRYDPPILINNVTSLWPITGGTDWCGKWEASNQSYPRSESEWVDLVVNLATPDGTKP